MALGLLMKKNILMVLFVIILIAGVVALYFGWQQAQPKPKAVSVVVPPPVSPPAHNPPTQLNVNLPQSNTLLPKSSESDKFMLNILAGLMSNKSSIGIFYNNQIIHNIVATIDSLSREHLPINVRPVKQASGPFITKGPENDKTISPENAARYSSYVRIAESIDARKLIEVYAQIYPLFQQAYEELGYPGKHFNDRLLVILDHLLDAPELGGSIKLLRPKVFYVYADPDMEARSAGQKILMRIGSKNEAKIKKKLRVIKRQVMLQMHDKKKIIAQ